jgi:hypothetical protein
MKQKKDARLMFWYLLPRVSLLYSYYHHLHPIIITFIKALFFKAPYILICISLVTNILNSCRTNCLRFKTIFPLSFFKNNNEIAPLSIDERTLFCEYRNTLLNCIYCTILLFGLVLYNRNRYSYRHYYNT